MRKLLLLLIIIFATGCSKKESVEIPVNDSTDATSNAINTTTTNNVSTAPLFNGVVVFSNAGRSTGVALSEDKLEKRSVNLEGKQTIPKLEVGIEGLNDATEYFKYLLLSDVVDYETVINESDRLIKMYSNAEKSLKFGTEEDREIFSIIFDGKTFENWLESSLDMYDEYDYKERILYSYGTLFSTEARTTLSMSDIYEILMQNESFAKYDGEGVDIFETDVKKDISVVLGNKGMSWYYKGEEFVRYEDTEGAQLKPIGYTVSTFIAPKLEDPADSRMHREITFFYLKTYPNTPNKGTDLGRVYIILKERWAELSNESGVDYKNRCLEVVTDGYISENGWSFEGGVPFDFGKKEDLDKFFIEFEHSESDNMPYVKFEKFLTY